MRRAPHTKDGLLTSERMAAYGVAGGVRGCQRGGWYGRVWGSGSSGMDCCEGARQERELSWEHGHWAELGAHNTKGYPSHPPLMVTAPPATRNMPPASTCSPPLPYLPGDVTVLKRPQRTCERNRYALPGPPLAAPPRPPSPYLSYLHSDVSILRCEQRPRGTSPYALAHTPQPGHYNVHPPTPLHFLPA